MADAADNRQALAEKIDPELLLMLARMSRRQQRQILLLLMVVENLLYEMERERRAREDLQ
jgi:tryptophan synthase alpha subunit